VNVSEQIDYERHHCAASAAGFRLRAHPPTVEGVHRRRVGWGFDQGQFAGDHDAPVHRPDNRDGVDDADDREQRCLAECRLLAMQAAPPLIEHRVGDGVLYRLDQRDQPGQRETAGEQIGDRNR
jgi:hypothetical protein